MRADKLIGTLVATTLLASCGGGSSSSPPPVFGGGGDGGGGGGNTLCSFADRQEWVLEQLQEYYLYPDRIATNVNPANYDTLRAYIDALLAPSQNAGLDKTNFTFVTSLSERDAFVDDGLSRDLGWEVVYYTGSGELVLLETYENGPAYSQAGLDRDDTILRIGRPGQTLRTPQDLYQNDIGLLNELLFESTAGADVVVEYLDSSTGRTDTETLEVREYQLDPVSSRYGAKMFGSTAYLNLRTFGTTRAFDQLEDSFRFFRNSGATDIVLDFRYNGGGLISVAEYLGDLMGDGFEGELFSETIYSAGVLRNFNVTDADRFEYFEEVANQLRPDRFAFITTNRSASASELVANAFPPYVGTDTALVGSNTSGKPVGQIPIEREACDDVLYVVALRTVNADGVGDYIDGLADTYRRDATTCRAADGVSFPLGDPNEPSIAQALDFIDGGPAVCSPISATATTQSAEGRAIQLRPAEPTYAQAIMSGLL